MLGFATSNPKPMKSARPSTAPPDQALSFRPPLSVNTPGTEKNSTSDAWALSFRPPLPANSAGPSASSTSDASALSFRPPLPMNSSGTTGKSIPDASALSFRPPLPANSAGPSTSSTSDASALSFRPPLSPTLVSSEHKATSDQEEQRSSQGDGGTADTPGILGSVVGGVLVLETLKTISRDGAKDATPSTPKRSRTQLKHNRDQLREQLLQTPGDSLDGSPTVRSTSEAMGLAVGAAESSISVPAACAPVDSPLAVAADVGGGDDLCEFCLSHSVRAAADSDLCVSTQRANGCHSCAQIHCWQTNEFCGQVPPPPENTSDLLCGFCMSFGVHTFEKSAWCAEVQKHHGCHQCSEDSCSTLKPLCPRALFAHRQRNPRPFYNAMHERGGGGSCFLNAALQALFAPPPIKEALAQLWRSMPRHKRENLLRSAMATRPLNIGGVGRPVDAAAKYEDLAAVTYRLCFADSARVPLHCHLLNDAFYKNEQEDSDEFLRSLLEGRVHVNSGSPTLVRAMSGTLQHSLKCTNGQCSGEVPSRTENFQWLNLSVQQDMVPVTCAQGALNTMALETPVENLVNTCPVCHRGSEREKQTWLMRTRVVEYPEVLVLVLNRWSDLTHPSLHTVKANDSVYFQGRRYALSSSVCHLGPTPHSGHYIALARHGDGNGTWYLYDDSSCSVASPIQASNEDLNYNFWGSMQSYILMYVKSREAPSQ